MKFDDIINEEGGTIKLSDGRLLFNTTKQRNKDLKLISKEIAKCEEELKKNNGTNKGEFLKNKLAKLRRDRIKIASGKKSEYITGGNFIDKNDVRVDNINFDNGNPDKLENWKARIKTEKELSNRLNNQNTKRKFRPR